MLKVIEFLCKIAYNVPGLYAVGIFANVLPGTDVKFIIKSSLFVQMFKGVCPAETEDWLCF
jgi:hypothetical protein